MSSIGILVALALLHLTGAAEGGCLLCKKYRFTTALDSNDMYRLHWSFDVEADTIAFAVNVSTTGWVGFGLSPNGQMPGSDVVIGWVDKNDQTQFHVGCKIIYTTANINIYHS